MSAKPTKKKTMQLLPMGSKTEEAWRMVNEIAPERADALAVSAFRYALTGEKGDGPGVPLLAWKKSKEEIDLLLTRRAAGHEGGVAKALVKALANGEPTLLPSSPLPEEKKTQDLKTEDSSFGFLQPSPSSDFGTWARMQKDPVDVALAAAEEGNEKRRRYGALLRDFREKWGKEAGSRLFIEVCMDFVAEVAAGELVENKGAALGKKLERFLAAPVEVAPAKASLAPVPAELEPSPAVEEQESERETGPTTLPLSEPVEETPEPKDAVSIALRACNGGEKEREKVAGLLAVVEHIPAWGEPKFRELCARYGENTGERTPDGFETYLRGLLPANDWAKAERAAEVVTNV